MKVLLGIDGTEDSLHALPRMIDRAADAGDDLTIAILDHPGNDRDPDDLYRRASEELTDSPIDAPIAVTKSRIFSFSSTRSKRCFSTLSTLPNSGRTA